MFVRLTGLEPARRETPDPKSGASTNFATSAFANAKVVFFYELKKSFQKVFFMRPPILLRNEKMKNPLYLYLSFFTVLSSPNTFFRLLGRNLAVAWNRAGDLSSRRRKVVIRKSQQIGK